MKKLLSLFFLLMALSSTTQAGSLMPAHSTICSQYPYNDVRCHKGSEFYFDQNERCGCVKAEEVSSPEVCEQSTITCNEDNGESYSLLYQYVNYDGFDQKIKMGCGCFNTNPWPIHG